MLSTFKALPGAADCGQFEIGLCRGIGLRSELLREQGYREEKFLKFDTFFVPKDVRKRGLLIPILNFDLMIHLPRSWHAKSTQ